jgi:hypothetical protein
VCKLDREIKLPRIPDAEDKLWDEIKKGFVARGCPKTPDTSSGQGRVRPDHGEGVRVLLPDPEDDDRRGP